MNGYLTVEPETLRAGAAEELVYGGLDQAVEQAWVNHVVVDHGGDALDRRVQDDADTLRIAGFQLTVGLSVLDQVDHLPECGVRCGADLTGSLPVFAGIHQVEQCGVFGGKAGESRYCAP